MQTVIKRSFLLISLLACIGITACTETTTETNKAEVVEQANTIVTEEAAAEVNEQKAVDAAEAETAPMGPLAYVPNEKDGNISVIDTATDKVVGLLPKDQPLGKKSKLLQCIPMVKPYMLLCAIKMQWLLWI